MLVIKRKLNQKIYIDDGRIELQVVFAEHGCCKIGITAPASVKVLRDDLLPEGPSVCCKCGGTLPLDGPGGTHVIASEDCAGQPDPDSGRCRVFGTSTLWGDLAAWLGGEGGAA